MREVIVEPQITEVIVSKTVEGADLVLQYVAIVEGFRDDAQAAADSILHNLKPTVKGAIKPTTKGIVKPTTKGAVKGTTKGAIKGTTKGAIIDTDLFADSSTNGFLVRVDGDSFANSQIQDDGVNPPSVPVWRAGDVDGGNYTEIQSNGRVKFYGDAVVERDILFPVLIRPTGPNRPTLETFVGNLRQLQFAVNDIGELDAQELPHDWKEGTPMEIFIHWATGGTDTNDRFVRWEVEFSWANVGDSFPVPTIQSCNCTIPANTPDRNHRYTVMGTFTPTGWQREAQIVMAIRRITADGTAPSAAPFALDVGIHYFADIIG